MFFHGLSPKNENVLARWLAESWLLWLPDPDIPEHTTITTLFTLQTQEDCTIIRIYTANPPLRLRIEVCAKGKISFTYSKANVASDKKKVKYNKIPADIMVIILYLFFIFSS